MGAESGEGRVTQVQQQAGKPRFGIYRDYYDGWGVCLHIGLFYVSVTY